ncbi:MAG: NTP transferase domain-containing protein [Geminicoccaceae bacterium]|nr:NTP transferase domain-containing protein [Geminicoccaceae bacterium]
MPLVEPEDVPVFILCGGLGTRLGEAAEGMPKPMVTIGDRPIVAHIMQTYRRHGYRRFVLCAGYRAEVLSTYFLSYAGIANDFTIDMGTREVAYHQSKAAPDWEVTIAHTGLGTQTGARIAQAAARHLGDVEHFAVTYGDGLTDADLGAELDFHLGHGRIGTSLAINPVSRFGMLGLDGGRVHSFSEKPTEEATWINGGFFLFRRRFMDYLDAAPDCVLEQAPLRRLTEDGELMAFQHQGFWSCMDTPRDRDGMRSLWESGAAPWQGMPGRADGTG